MDYKNININQIKLKGTSLVYMNKKLDILLPKMKCFNGIEKYYNKYQILLEIDDEKVLLFLRNMESHIKKYLMEEYKFKSNIKNIKDVFYLIMKVPYRYNNYEINIESENIYLPTSQNIEKDKYLKCKINISKIWNYENNNAEKYSGYMLDVKDIFIE